jgi:hypothetical protein
MELKVPIPKGMQPGQKLRVRRSASDELIITTLIPPMSQWTYYNNNDTTTPSDDASAFFILSINDDNIIDGDAVTNTRRSIMNIDSAANMIQKSFRQRKESAGYTTYINPAWKEMRKRDIVKDMAKKTANAVTTKREPGILPKSVLDILDKLENEHVTVTSMIVVRTPIQEYVGTIMNVISIGKYKEVMANSPYDCMFHLSLCINGRYILEKNESIALSDKGSNSSSPPSGSGEYRNNNDILDDERSETIEVSIPANDKVTLRQLLLNTREYMGYIKFSNYCAKTNNCQDFILALLSSNHLSSPQLEQFIKQDAEQIFNRLPKHTTTVARTLTDVAAIMNKLVEDIVVTCTDTVTQLTSTVTTSVANTLPAKKLSLAPLLPAVVRVKNQDNRKFVNNTRK